MNYLGDDVDGGGKATPSQLSPARKTQRLNSAVTGTGMAPGYWFNNNSMTYGTNPMTYGIGAGNNSTLGHGTGGNGQFHLGGLSRNLFDDGRMNPIGGGGGMGPYGMMMQPVFSPYAQSAATAAHPSSYTQTHRTQPASIAAMTTGGDNQENGGCSWKSSSTGCQCRGAVQLFVCCEVGCGRMSSHMCQSGWENEGGDSSREVDLGKNYCPEHHPCYDPVLGNHSTGSHRDRIDENNNNNHDRNDGNNNDTDGCLDDDEYTVERDWIKSLPNSAEKFYNNVIMILRGYRCLINTPKCTLCLSVACHYHSSPMKKQ